MRISDWSSDVCSSDLEHLDRHRRTRFLDLPPLIVNQRADAAAFGAADENIADLQSAAADEDRHHRAPALVELRLRSEERRVGNDCVRTCRARCSPDL